MHGLCRHLSLRRRFRQNQDDISYTIMALIPTLSKHILEEMDVESITRELQSMSKSSRPLRQLPTQVEPSESSLTSSVEVVQVQDQDAASDNGSMVLSSISGPEDTRLSESSTSWVDRLSPIEPQSHSQSGSVSNLPPATSSGIPGGSPPAIDRPDSPGLHLSDSVTTSSSMLDYENEDASAVCIVYSSINNRPTRYTLAPARSTKHKLDSGLRSAFRCQLGNTNKRGTLERGKNTK
jgi:peroxin-3